MPTDQPKPTPPTHIAGCPCELCEGERRALDDAIKTLREAGEII